MLLGIDQGTTGTRACLVDPELTIVTSAYAPHAQHTPAPGHVEHDAAEIWACTQKVVAHVVGQGGKPRGVALANQGETVMLWDALTGAPLHRALVWQDTRTAAWIEALAPHDARVRELTGLRLDAYFSASKLRWLLDNVPGARALAASQRLRAGTIDTWLIDRLTAVSALSTSTASAASSVASPSSDAQLTALAIARTPPSSA